MAKPMNTNGLMSGTGGENRPAAPTTNERAQKKAMKELASRHKWA